MGYDNEPSFDEDGEPLMDHDADYDRENSPDPLFDDGVGGDDDEDWRRERSPTPAYDEDKIGKPRKRLVKKSGEKESVGIGGEGLEDWEEYVPSSSLKKKKKRKVSEEEGGRKERRNLIRSSS